MVGGVDRDTAMDVVQSTIEATLVRLSKGVDIKNLEAYLFTVARHQLIRERLRSARNVNLPDMEQLALSDDAAVKALDNVATIADVRSVLQRVAASDDTTMYQVAVCMLNITQQTGSVPSTRTVARVLGLSHTGVAKAIERMKRYFAAVHHEFGSP
jgi:uncharacterized protein YerC